MKIYLQTGEIHKAAPPLPYVLQKQPDIPTLRGLK